MVAFMKRCSIVPNLRKCHVAPVLRINNHLFPRRFNPIVAPLTRVGPVNRYTGHPIGVGDLSA